MGQWLKLQYTKLAADFEFAGEWHICRRSFTTKKLHAFMEYW
jgi:hypothetical protein